MLLHRGCKFFNPDRFTQISQLLTGLRLWIFAQLFLNTISRCIKVFHELFFACLVRNDSYKEFRTNYCLISKAIDQLVAEILLLLSRNRVSTNFHFLTYNASVLHFRFKNRTHHSSKPLEIFKSLISRNILAKNALFHIEIAFIIPTISYSFVD